MLPKLFRLTKEKDFNRVYKKGKFFAQDFLMCKIAENNFDFSRFGIVVGTKISKRANKRNLIRRRLREAIRLKIKDIKKGFDVVMMVRPEILNKDYREIDKKVTILFRKARLLR